MEILAIRYSLIYEHTATNRWKRESEKTIGKYNCNDVVNQLYYDFHDKCYIYEYDAQNMEVEHLLPHKGGMFPERNYDWDNLFLSRVQRNKVKNQRKYEGDIWLAVKRILLGI